MHWQYFTGGISLKLTSLFVGVALLSATLVRAEDDDSDKDKGKESSFKVDRGDSSASTKNGETTDYRKIRRRAYTVVQTQDWPFNWSPDPAKSITRVEIRLGEQRAYFYQGLILVGDAPVSTGCPGRETPAGKYKVLAKELKHYSNLYGELLDDKGHIVNMSAEVGDPIPKGLHYQSSPMPYYLRLTDDGVGMHEGWLPGYAASHGCIRMPYKFAPLIYAAIPVGTPVAVLPDPHQPVAAVAPATNKQTKEAKADKTTHTTTTMPIMGTLPSTTAMP